MKMRCFKEYNSQDLRNPRLFGNFVVRQSLGMLIYIQ